MARSRTRTRTRSRWIVPLGSAAALAVCLTVGYFFLVGPGKPRQAVLRSTRYPFAKEEPRLSQAPVTAFTSVLGLTDGQKTRVQPILQGMRAQDLAYERRRMAAVMAYYGPMGAQRSAPSPLMNHPMTRGMAIAVERLKLQWRRRQRETASDGLDRMEEENDRAVREREAKALENIQAVLTDRQREKLPLIRQALHDLRSVGLPISFCTDVLQDPRQRAALSAIAAEADRERTRHTETYKASVQALQAARNGLGGTRAWEQERRRFFGTVFQDLQKTERTAYRRALATLNPAQRQVIRRSGANFTP